VQRHGRTARNSGSVLGMTRVQRLVGRKFLGEKGPEGGFGEEGGGFAHREEGNGGDAEPEFVAQLEGASEEAEGPGV